MRLAATLSVFLWLSATASAQSPASQPATMDAGATEWMITGGPAFGVEVFHSAAGHRYILQSISWGRVLTRARGRGVFRGRFEWALEFVPMYGQYDPVTTVGFGVTPLAWRWNFEPRGKLTPFAELGGGALWTRDPVPENTTTANFTAHIAYGVRYFVRSQTAIVAAYRFHHISNGNRLDENPGVNAHVMQFGVSFARPH